MTALQSLIARVEAATADQQRELLEQAFLVVFPEPARYRGDLPFADAMGHPEHRAVIDKHYHWRHQQRGVFMRMLDAGGFVDAALTLVPEGWDWSLHSGRKGAVMGCSPPSDDGCEWSDCNAATPALAICLSALRARAAQGEG